MSGAAESSSLPPFDDFASEVRLRVGNHLEGVIARVPDIEVARLAKYVTLEGGHRWRSIAAVATGRIFRADALEALLPTASAIELVHAASLLMDDLPSMDNAEIRHGRPCAHRVFPRWAVDMGAVFMITMAYELILGNEAVDHTSRVEVARLLSRAGLEMVAGQELDIAQRDSDQIPARDLLECHRLKTGALFSAAVAAGAMQCGAGPEDVALLTLCGECLGLAYQLLDDLEEVRSGSEALGKRPDARVDRTNAVWLLGGDVSEQIREGCQDKAVALLAGFGPRAAHLRDLLRKASCL